MSHGVSDVSRAVDLDPPGDSDSVAVRFDDLHHFTPYGRLPQFVQLLRDCPQRGEELHGNSLEAFDWVSEIRVIEGICEGFGFRTLLADISIIQDQRVRHRDASPYLVNYVVCYCEADDAPRVLSCYRDAITYMSQTRAGQAPLVPYTAFYEYAYLATPLYKHAAFVRSTGTGDTQSSYCSQSAFRQRYPYKEISNVPRDVNPPDQLGRLAGQFLRNATAQGCIHDSFSDAYLVAIPFHRAPYEPALSGRDELKEGEQSRGALEGNRTSTAGGGAFVILKPQVTLRNEKKEQSLNDCTMALQIMLMRAGLTESYNELDTRIRYIDLLTSMVHGAVHSIKWVGSERLCSIVTVNTAMIPPDSTDDLKAPIRANEAIARPLVRALKRTCFGEKTATALLSFAEMSLSFERGAERCAIRKKFRSRRPKRVAEVIKEAVELANGVAGGPYQQRHGIRLELDEMGPSGARNGHWRLPAGYFGSSIVRGLFSEVFDNASLYGDAGNSGSVDVSCAVHSAEDVGTVRCAVSNRTVNEEEVEIKGVLFRLKQALKRIGGVELKWSPGSDRFVVEVCLGPALFESPDGIEEVQPEWDSSPEE